MHHARIYGFIRNWRKRYDSIIQQSISKLCFFRSQLPKYNTNRFSWPLHSSLIATSFVVGCYRLLLSILCWMIWIVLFALLLGLRVFAVLLDCMIGLGVPSFELLLSLLRLCSLILLCELELARPLLGIPFFCGILHCLDPGWKTGPFGLLFPVLYSSTYLLVVRP